MATNRRKVPTGRDFYVTPAHGTLALLENETFDGPICEPCCGDGAMVKAMREFYKSRGQQKRITASDKYAHGFGRRLDFFNKRAHVSNIVTNPPFGIAEEILHHALTLADNKVCLLLRTAFLEGQKRYETIYKDNPPSRVLIFSERLSIFKKDVKRTSGGTTSYAWFVWDRTRLFGPTEIEWIKPRGSREQ